MTKELHTLILTAIAQNYDYIEKRIFIDLVVSYNPPCTTVVSTSQASEFWDAEFGDC